ncbi:MAG: MafI family immunity protein [Bacteroidota bacterium]|nr:MafI family immunity protein [Bacteroidota bacterium]
MKNVKERLQLLNTIAKALGLGENDWHNVEEFIKYKEYGLGFDTLITQLYEYDIEINNETYELIVLIGNKLKLQKDKYSFMQELIRRNQKIDTLVGIVTTSWIKFV